MTRPSSSITKSSLASAGASTMFVTHSRVSSSVACGGVDQKRMARGSLIM
jgi:hypothetical protein